VREALTAVWNSGLKGKLATAEMRINELCTCAQSGVWLQTAHQRWRTASLGSAQLGQIWDLAA